MTELKTFKDIGVEARYVRKDAIVVIPEILKAEAIKWVKSKPIKELGHLPKPTIEWIKHFFNLTEEDLK